MFCCRSNIKVISLDKAKKYHFDAVIIFAWNYTNTISKKIDKSFKNVDKYVLIPKFKN